MKKLVVWYEGWGERWPLGALADDREVLLFEYSPEALRQGLELSPRHLKLREQAYGGFPEYLDRLPGLVADALPDGWGRLLLDRLFRKNGRNPATLSPLDRLSFLGDRALGALTFEPASGEDLPAEDVSLLALARASQAVIAERDTEALRQLALMGGSPHGARPKVVVHYDPASGLMSTTPTPFGRPWLVKFQAQGEHKEACALEDLYAVLARRCGLEVPASRLFDLDRNLAAYGSERFDVEEGLRVPVHTLAGFLHADFRRAGAVDYTTFLRATRMLTRDEREVHKAYERAVFNVVFHNQDDHPKNFSFRLGRDRHWRLAPCYDLTFSEGPGGEHHMDVCGAGRNITRAHMLELARQTGVTEAWAATTINRFIAEAGALRHLGMKAPIRKATLQRVEAAVATNRGWLR